MTSTAQIGGPAEFHGREQPVVAAGAKLASPIQVEITQEIRRSRRSTARLVIHEIFSYGAALLAGILLVTVFPGFYPRDIARDTRASVSRSASARWRFSPVRFLIVLGILLLFVGVGAGIAGVLGYAPILYVAQVFVGAWLGNQDLGEKTRTMRTRRLAGSLSVF